MNRSVLGLGVPTHGKARIVAVTAYVTGAITLLGSSYVHFHLWQHVGYSHIPTIGPLFLAQSVIGFVLALGIIALRRVWIALLGVGMAIATIAGFLTSVEFGLFGFRDFWSAPYAVTAFDLEMLTVSSLLVAALLCVRMGTAPRAATPRQRR